MSSHNDLEQNISNLEFRIDELESSQYFSKKEVEDNFITREEVRILINRFQEKISQLEEKLEVAEKQINSNKQQIGALYNIQLYGKPN